MKIEYLFSSDRGDIPVEKEMLHRPFIVSPMEKHHFLTLGDFFSGIRGFFICDNGTPLKDLIMKRRGENVSLEKIGKIVIRYEKYGVFYHILSIEVESDSFIEKFAMSAAQLPEAKKTLEKEYKLFTHLNQKFNPPYIQQVYRKANIKITRDNNIETFLIMLSNWFEGYHEWHFTGKQDNAESAIIWDMEKGYHSISQKEITKIILEASKVLTLYYDSGTFHRIYPWHHGAGDFIIRLKKEDTDVRLISVRGYEPINQLLSDKNLSPIDAIIFFLIEMSIKMRVDKYEGMGDPVWAGDFILSSILEGFNEGLRLKEAKGDFPGLSTKGVIGHLNSISIKDLKSMFFSYLDVYRKTDPVDFGFIDSHSKKHIADLYHVIQSL
ncbi:hypothetical protein ACFL1Z_04895 [Thermodesulfobacteriota bacterium]